MTLPELCIRRPVGTTLLTMALILAGAIAFRLLPAAALPQVDFPAISVSAQLPGAEPQTMATSVAAPLERQFARIAGLSEMTSQSSRGSTRINLIFDLDRDINGAARDVQSAINAAMGYLPSTLRQNPTYRKMNPADAPVMVLALTSDTVSRTKMYDVASTVLQQKLSQVDGVGQVFVGGGALPAVRVNVDPAALAAKGLSLADVKSMLTKTTVNKPKGGIEAGDRSYEVETNDQLHEAWQYQPLILSYKNGAAVRLTDVATITPSVEDVRTAGFVNGKPSVMVIVFRQPGANIIETVDNVKALIPQLRASLPGDVDISVEMDRSPPIRASLAEVERTLIISCLLVILVVFVFLGSARATLIPAVATVASLVGTFAVMYLLGYSLDNLSLMALTIATGFVVDDAIVVVENVARHMEQGMAPRAASLLGSKEVAFTVVSMSVSLVAVFIPILLMGGMVGRLFREFAMVLSIAILISLLLSLTSTPTLCAVLLRPVAKKASGRPWLTARAFAWLHRGYERSLAFALSHPRLMLTATVGALAGAIWLYVAIPKGFFPEQDTGRVMGFIQAAPDTSFQAMEKKLRTVIKVIGANPDVASVTGFTGGGGGPGGGGTNSAQMFITLRPKNKRPPLAVTMGRLRKALAAVPGTPAFLMPAQELRMGGRPGKALYQYTLLSDSYPDLVAASPKVEAAMKKLPGLTDVSADQQDNGLMTFVDVDRDTASRLGVTSAAVDAALYSAFGQSLVGVSYTDQNQYHVVLEVSPRIWQSPEGLRKIYVAGTDGKQIPLASVARFRQSEAALSVNHQGQFPAATISFNLAPGVALSQAAQAIEAATRALHLPSSVRGSFAGTAEAFKSSLSTQPLLLLAALIAVYIVLGILYESTIHPLTILSTLPSAGLGAVAALMAFRMDLTIIAVIGIILLIGIVKKNGIMLVDFALSAERERDLSPRDAIYEACLKRFRPIMMTTMAAFLGALPLALGTGSGAELRRPLGIAIAGGLLVSQAMTLYTTPVIYLYLDRLRCWGRGPLFAKRGPLPQTPSLPKNS
ncbi:acriflavin resistance protein [Solidesulfovibrio fructosivorans JJ]]|uniref:Acriflavin resistance protein n=1 Tax=Solidesulfovibrio fructosivorans JJ] TaxID=596151 RepID=E1K058_SOLFR|nr:efflux RND transporter permease subunit [Solidesulfovibrio fructosivorans]EFL49976.1 acriflavin resistance protein [Solidesulfovibrio fructosivorans JJ]]